MGQSVKVVLVGSFLAIGGEKNDIFQICLANLANSDRHKYVQAGPYMVILGAAQPRASFGGHLNDI